MQNEYSKLLSYLILFKKKQKAGVPGGSGFKFLIWVLRPALVENGNNGKLRATMSIF